MKNTILLIAVVALGAGCSSVRNQVPATTLKGTYLGQPYNFAFPKDESITNFDLTLNTNGTLHIHADGMTAAMNPAVITMTGNAYQVMRQADSQLLNSAITTASGAIGQVAGSAAK